MISEVEDEAKDGVVIIVLETHAVGHNNNNNNMGEYKRNSPEEREITMAQNSPKSTHYYGEIRQGAQGSTHQQDH